MNYKTLILCLLVIAPIGAKTDKILDMIRRIDPYGLNELHIPGFFIKADEKKRYEAAAKEVTDKAYRSLHSVALYDFVRFVKGSVKSLAGGALIYGAYLFYKGDGKYTYNISKNTLDGLSVNPTLFDGNTHQFVTKLTGSAVLGGLGLYVFSHAWGDFADIYNKQQRILAYHNALAQEAYIQRLPVCDVGACETVLDE